MLWLSPQIELKQFLIYCDPYIAELENCCELQEPKVKRFNASKNNWTYYYIIFIYNKA